MAESPSLRTLQQDFWALISAPTGVADGLLAMPERARTLDLITDDARGAAVDRLDLYANMYFYRLHDNLALDFPKLVAVLGPQAFHNLATDYLHACPSQHPSARYVGERLPSFLRSHHTAEQRPWLADLASLEWARVDMTDRADDQPLTLADLQTAAASNFATLTLRLIQAHTLVATTHAVEAVWRALHHDQPHGDPAASTSPTLLIWRHPDQRVHHRRTTEEEAALLPKLAEGLSFVQLCEHLMQAHPPQEAAQQAVTLVSTWTQAHLLATPDPKVCSAELTAATYGQG